MLVLPLRGAGRVVASDPPGLAAVGPDDLDRGTTFARHEAEGQGEDLARDLSGVIGSRSPDEDESTVDQSVEFQGPGIAIDDQEFSRVDFRVEVELPPSRVIVA